MQLCPDMNTAHTACAATPNIKWLAKYICTNKWNGHRRSQIYRLTRIGNLFAFEYGRISFMVFVSIVTLYTKTASARRTNDLSDNNLQWFSGARTLPCVVIGLCDGIMVDGAIILHLCASRNAMPRNHQWSNMMVIAFGLYQFVITARAREKDGQDHARKTPPKWLHISTIFGLAYIIRSHQTLLWRMVVADDDVHSMCVTHCSQNDIRIVFFLRLMRIKTHRQPIYTHDPWYLMKTTHAFTTPLSRASRTHMSTEHAHGQHETRCGNSCSRLADEEDPKATCRCARAFPVFLPISC